MFGRKNDGVEDLIEVPRGRPMVVKALDPEKKVAQLSSARMKAAHTDAGSDKPREGHKTDGYHDIKRQLFGALIEIIDVSQLAKMDAARARTEISDVVSEIVSA